MLLFYLLLALLVYAVARRVAIFPRSDAVCILLRDIPLHLSRLVCLVLLLFHLLCHAVCVGLSRIRLAHAGSQAVQVLLELCKLARLVELMVSLGVVLHRFHIIGHLLTQDLLFALLKRHFLLLFDLPGYCFVVDPGQV